MIQDAIHLLWFFSHWKPIHCQGYLCTTGTVLCSISTMCVYTAWDVYITWLSVYTARHEPSHKAKRAQSRQISNTWSFLYACRRSLYCGSDYHTNTNNFLVGTLVPTRKLVFMIVNKIMWAVQKLLVYLTYAHIHKRLCKCLGMFRGFGAGLPTMWSLITLWVWECMMDLHLAESILLM